MTTLVLVQTKDDVIMGWDSLVTQSNEAGSIVNPKVFVNGELIFAVAGNTRALDLVETTPFPKYDGTDPRHWLIKNVSPVLWQIKDANDAYLSNESGGMAFSVLVVVAGQAFQIDSSGSPSQYHDGIYTRGSGGDYARGALYANKIQMPGNELDESDVMLALEVAIDNDPYSGGALTVGFASKYLKANS